MATDLKLLLKRNTERWDNAMFKPASLKLARTVAKRLVAPRAKAIYQRIEKATGVPWFAIAMIHEREASQRWDRHLGQGDSLNKKTVNVPKGRGPFTGPDAFFDGAVDALVKCPPYAAKWKDWSPGGMLTVQEMYNGLGYANGPVDKRKNPPKKYPPQPSAYIWSGTNQYTKGKYIRDFVFDANTVDSQLGCAVLLKAMMEIDDSIYPPVANIADIQPESADDGVEIDPDAFPDPAVPVEVEPPQVEPPTPPTAPTTTVVTDTFNGVKIVGDPDTFIIQSLLKKMNYSPGLLDGQWGGATGGAILGLINDRGLSITPPASFEEFEASKEQIKLAVRKADGEDWKRPVSPERKKVDAAVVAEVAPEIKPINQSYFAAKWLSITTFFTGLYKGFEDKIERLWNFVFDHKDTLQENPSLLKTAWSYVLMVPLTFWILAGAATIGLLAFNIGRAGNRINKSVETGARQ